MVLFQESSFLLQCPKIFFLFSFTTTESAGAHGPKYCTQGVP